MVNDGRSSLQKAAARSGSTSSLSKANSQSRRGTNSFEIRAPVASSAPVVDRRGAKTQSTCTISDASDTVGGDIGTAAVGGEACTSNKKTAKSTQHFTIISAHDEHQHDNSDFMDVDHHHEINHGSMDIEDTIGMPPENAQPYVPSTAKTQTYLQIGGFREEKKNNAAVDVGLACGDDIDDRPIEQMEGVIDQGSKLPLVVLDGANVAYAYAGVMAGNNNSSLEAASSMNNRGKLEPDVRGIQIATEFFLEASVRALIVLPQYWFRGNNINRSAPQLEILGDLKAKGLIVASPPTDDDDAYALTISRREEARSRKPPRNGEGPGFVLSNDLFRDAQERDAPNRTLKEWLTKGRNADVGPGRISYTFGDMGNMNDRGERVLDFVPNPRHPLIIWMESKCDEITHSYVS